MSLAAVPSWAETSPTAGSRLVAYWTEPISTHWKGLWRMIALSSDQIRTA